MAGGKDDDQQNDSWPWNDRVMRDAQAAGDRLLSELRRGEQETEGQRDNSNNSSIINNPFSAFKQFIDSNFNTLTEGFKDFPANLREIKAKMQREQEQRQAEQLDISKRWTGSSDTPDHIQMELLRSTKEEREDAHASAMTLLHESLRRNRNVPVEKIEALYEDQESILGDLDRLVNPMLALGGAWYYMPETGDRLAVGKDRWRWLAPSPRWLSVDWFKRSPYSPIRLEAHPELSAAGTNWRAAFEDLLNASLDKPMTGSVERVGMRSPHGRPQSTHYGPGLEWMLSLQCRGILPPMLPRWFNHAYGKRALQHGTVADHLSRISSDIHLTGERSLMWNSQIEMDVSELVSEIATKATAETEAEPIEFDTLEAETEQDLYDSPWLYPPHDVARAFSEDTKRTFGEAFEASRGRGGSNAMYYDDDDDDGEQDLDETQEALSSTLSGSEPQNSETGMQLLSPDDKKRIALTRQSENMTPEDWATHDEILERLQLEKRIRDLTGVALSLPILTIGELKEMAEDLEYEYDNLFGTKSAKESEEQKPPVTPKKPDVLSALTTTHTTRLPDGTVTTKVVLKKHFTDGTEETTESVHTTNEALEQQHRQAQREGNEQPRKTGWFWK